MYIPKNQTDKSVFVPPQPTFFKMWFLIDKIWLKLAKMNWFSNFFANFSHVLWSKNHVLKKVGWGGDENWFVCLVFRNLHALGYLKLVTVFLCSHFWVNKSLSMMWLHNNFSISPDKLYSRAAARGSNISHLVFFVCQLGTILPPTSYNTLQWVVGRKVNTDVATKNKTEKNPFNS
jgi:hypothetical protein